MPFAVVVIDMLNPYEHPDAEPLKRSVREMVPSLRRLLERADEREDAFVVYVNDNYADWTAGRHRIAEKALAGAEPDLVQPILPPDHVPFVVKARHSVFYGTQLEYMLRYEGIDRLLLAGQVTEQCILYSALDAYVRHFELTIARDCVAHIDPELGQAALRMMESNMRARICDSGLDALATAAAESS